MKIFYASVFCVWFSAMLFNSCVKNDESPKAVSRIDTLTVKTSMKGWELYSWPEKNIWRFAFLTGTNRIKSLAEVTTEAGDMLLIRVTGIDSVKLVLNKIPPGESIMMIGEGWLQNTWKEQSYGALQLPPQSVVNEIKEYGDQKHITINSTN